MINFFKRIKLAFVPILLAFSLSACVTDGMGTKQTWGTILGAAGGGVAGSQFGKGDGRLIGVAIGTMAGAFIGSEIGSSLDKADQMAIAKQTQNALEYTPNNQQVVWNNPNTGVQSVVVPTNTYQTNTGYCREYQNTIMIGGKEEVAYGKACRQPDGSWKIS